MYFFYAHIGMYFNAIKINRRQCLFAQLPILKARRTEIDIVGIPLTRTSISMLGRFGLINNGTHAMWRFIAI